MIEQDMNAVAGMSAANRRLARMGVAAVDLSYCEHGHNAECTIHLGRSTAHVESHGNISPLAAVDDLVERVAALRVARLRKR